MKLTKSFALIAALVSALSMSWTSKALAEQIILQSTTSTANSGLYEAILPLFRDLSGVIVHVVAVGTGQAIKNARNGDADVLLVHAKAAEEQFVADGFGHQFPSIPVILGQSVFDTHDRVLVCPSFPEVDQLPSGHAIASGFKNVLVGLCVVEFGSSSVQGNQQIVTRTEARFFDGLDDHLNGFLVGAEVRCKPTLIANVGSTAPASICVDASEWSSYSGGVFDGSCKSGYYQLDHCVQLIGYTGYSGSADSSSDGYYIVRNSWGSDWGEDGMIYLPMGSNACGVATEATFVTIA